MKKPAAAATSTRPSIAISRALSVVPNHLPSPAALSVLRDLNAPIAQSTRLQLAVLTGAPAEYATLGRL